MLSIEFQRILKEGLTAPWLDIDPKIVDRASNRIDRDVGQSISHEDKGLFRKFSSKNEGLLPSDFSKLMQKHKSGNKNNHSLDLMSDNKVRVINIGKVYSKNWNPGIQFKNSLAMPG